MSADGRGASDAFDGRKLGFTRENSRYHEQNATSGGLAPPDAGRAKTGRLSGLRTERMCGRGEASATDGAGVRRRCLAESTDHRPREAAVERVVRLTGSDRQNLPSRKRRVVNKVHLSGKLAVFVLLLVLGQMVLAQTGHTLPLVMSASNRVQEGLVRIINHSERAGTVDIVAIDDAGERFGPVTLSLDALEAVNFDAVDLEEGNTEVNLSGGVGDGEGNWHLELDTTLDIEALAYIRSTDGFLNTVHDVVADDGSLRYYVPTFNPSYRSLLRLVNQADADTDVTITGRDGEGGPAPEGEVRLTLPPYAACTVTALELESGDISSDCPTAVSGRFGNGTRKWRLLISADHPLQVLSLLKSSTGEQLANLSASGRAPGFAPADQAEFDADYVGKRALSDDPSNYADFVSAGRFRETEGTETYTGDYTYEKTGPNTGTLEFHYDDGDRCTSDIAFDSTTTGTSTYSCDGGEAVTTSWEIVDISSSDASDLVMEAPSVSDSSLEPGASFTLSATVRNQGSAPSAATTLRYYRSSNTTISSADTEVGTDNVSGLAASGTSNESIALSAPSSAGTYYYGACVDTVSGESDTANNCSSAVRVTVSSGGVASIPRHPFVTTRFSPTQLVIGHGAKLILNWNSVTGATSYKVRVSYVPILFTRRASGSCSVSGSLTTQETHYTHEFTALSHNEFYYLVLACNSAGCSCPQ